MRLPQHNCSPELNILFCSRDIISVSLYKLFPKAVSFPIFRKGADICKELRDNYQYMFQTCVPSMLVVRIFHSLALLQSKERTVENSKCCHQQILYLLHLKSQIQIEGSQHFSYNAQKTCRCDECPSATINVSLLSNLSYFLSLLFAMAWFPQ